MTTVSTTTMQPAVPGSPRRVDIRNRSGGSRVKRWLLSGTPVSILAVFSAVIAVGQWLILLLVSLMMVDADAATRAFILVAFFAWPAAAVAAVAASVLVRPRPRLAAGLLLLVAFSLVYPVPIGAAVALTGAALAFASRNTVSVQALGSAGRGVLEVPRALVIGVAAFIGLLMLAQLVIYFLSLAR